MLDSNKIQAVISTLSPPTPEVHAAQDNLIRASAQSSTPPLVENPPAWLLRRYSNESEQKESNRHLSIPWKLLKSRSRDLLAKYPPTTLEYTIFLNGYFMDYFGMPHYQAYMTPETPFVDIDARKAAIPGSGDDPVVWTLTRDVARFVRKMVESTGAWPVFSRVVGDVATINEITRVAQDARGTEFEIIHDSLADLRAGRITEIPAYVKLYDVFPKEMLLEMMAGLGVGMITGLFDFAGEELLNEKFPDVGTVKMREFIKEHWSGQ
ncbi:MAG: hypothetical protein L6R37_002107 [Teloschistes peruensis]|nr:MAG: hypothetical protein L6R37_002107 [Teloschistes peruensis]